MPAKTLVAGGSVRGRDHILSEKPCQDSYHFFQAETKLGPVTAGVVCDGCGSGEFTQVGAQIGARMLSSSILNILEAQETERSPGEFMEAVRHDVLTKLLGLITHMGAKVPTHPELEQDTMRFSWLVQHLALFTAVGFVITPNQGFIYHIGDGYYAFNGKMVCLEPEGGNSPIYLSYGFTKTNLQATPEHLQFKIHESFHPDHLQHLVVATDGARDLIENQCALTPDRGSYVGDLLQFQDPKFFKNSDMVRRRLAIINKTGQTIDWDNRQIVPYRGHLRDDTTLITVAHQSLAPVVLTPVPSTPEPETPAQ